MKKIGLALVFQLLLMPLVTASNADARTKNSDFHAQFHEKQELEQNTRWHCGGKTYNMDACLEILRDHARQDNEQSRAVLSYSRVSRKHIMHAGGSRQSQSTIRSFSAQ